jgi:hypothetical protein
MTFGVLEIRGWLSQSDKSHVTSHRPITTGLAVNSQCFKEGNSLRGIFTVNNNQVSYTIKLLTLKSTATWQRNS